MTYKYILALLLVFLLTACSSIAAPAKTPAVIVISNTATISPTSTVAPSSTPTPVPTPTPDLRVGGFLLENGKIYEVTSDGYRAEQNLSNELQINMLTIDDTTVLALDENGETLAWFENGKWTERILTKERVSIMTIKEKLDYAPKETGLTKGGIANETMVVYRDSDGKITKLFELTTGRWLLPDHNSVKKEMVGTGWDNGSSMVLVETIKESKDITSEIMSGKKEVEHIFIDPDDNTSEIKDVGIEHELKIKMLTLSKMELQIVSFDRPYVKNGVTFNDVTQLVLTFCGKNDDMDVIAFNLVVRSSGMYGIKSGSATMLKHFPPEYIYEFLRVGEIYYLWIYFVIPNSDITNIDPGSGITKGVLFKKPELLGTFIGSEDGNYNRDELIQLILNNQLTSPLWMGITEMPKR